MTNKKRPGGLRNPPGGRPVLPENKRRVKLSITLDPATVAKVRALRAREREPLSQVVERLLEERLSIS